MKMRAINLKNAEASGGTSDPFLELQRKRKAVGGGDVWDCVFRSRPAPNNLSPKWKEACVELSSLCNGDLDSKFRVAVYDFNESDRHALMGSFEASVNDLIRAVTKGAGKGPPENVSTEKAFRLLKDDEDVGKIVVISAGTSGIEEKQEPVYVLPREAEPEIVVEATGSSEIVEDIAVDPDDPIELPQFVDYISGGCQLRVIVAIDYTASNGKPNG